ncbi:hypothetical protein GpartN1_g5544.t1 [Galdieria partita]|uniref:Uncharacterized protein n=1 Tax=Galdieria partita TaxID=83374 RepID=A0A9C7PZG7_9RHOD|nr:hypothetical protein GpartN1_g5544.t1 [Galdieria partita]
MGKINKEEVIVECRCELLQAIREGSYEQVVAVLDWLSGQLCPKLTCSKAIKESLQQWQSKCDCPQHSALKKALSRVLVDCNLLHRNGRKDVLPLQLSSSYPNTRIWSLLLSLQEQTTGEETLELCDSDSGWNILHRCCYFGNLSHMKVLLQSNFDQSFDSRNKICLKRFRILCSVTDNEGYLPLDLLLSGKNQDKEPKAGDPLQGHNIGMVMVFGSNEDFELGTGSNSFERIPRPLEWPNSVSQGGTNIVSVSTSSRHSLFLSKNGNVFSVGVGKDGRLGLGDSEPRLSPQPVSFLSRIMAKKQSTASPSTSNFQPDSNFCFSKILAKGNRSGALSSDGVLYLWGDGVLKPERVQGPLRGLTVVDFAFCSSHTAVVTKDGAVFCWGSNDLEQLGVEYSCVKFTNIPRLVSSLKNIMCTCVFVDDGISAVIDSQGRVFFWGKGNGSPNRLFLQEKATQTRKRVGKNLKAKKVVFLVKKNCLLVLTEHGQLYEFFVSSRDQISKYSLVATRTTWTRKILLADLACQDCDCIGLDSYGRVIVWSLEDEVPKMTIKSDLRAVAFVTFSERHGFAGIKMPLISNNSKVSTSNRDSAPSLQELCETKLGSSISLASAFPLLSISSKLGNERVFQFCVNFLVQCLDTILCFFPQTFANLENELVTLLESHYKETWKKDTVVASIGQSSKNPIDRLISRLCSSWTLQRNDESFKGSSTLEDSNESSANGKKLSMTCNDETSKLQSSQFIQKGCTEPANSSTHAGKFSTKFDERSHRSSKPFKRLETMKLLCSSTVFHREQASFENQNEVFSASRLSSVKLSLKDAIQLEEEKRKTCWNIEPFQRFRSSSLKTIQIEQFREMNKDEWSSLCVAHMEVVDKAGNSSGGAETDLASSMKGRRIRKSSPSISIPCRQASSSPSDSIITSSPAWGEEKKARNEPTSFRDIIDEEKRRKSYFSSSLSPSSLSPSYSRVWKKLPSEEPVMVKPLKKIETEELALKTLRTQYPSAQVKRAPYQ